MEQPCLLLPKRHWGQGSTMTLTKINFTIYIEVIGNRGSNGQQNAILGVWFNILKRRENSALNSKILPIFYNPVVGTLDSTLGIIYWNLKLVFRIIYGNLQLVFRIICGNTYNVCFLFNLL